MNSRIAPVSFFVLCSASFIGCEGPGSERLAPVTAPRAPAQREAPTVTAPSPAPSAPPAPAPSSCTLPGAPAAVVATETGVALAFATGPDAGLRVQRMRGEGCALSPEGDAVAAGELLDADDLGNLYVFPSRSDAPEVVDTMLPGEYPGSMVARVDAHGNVMKLLPAGRGIWGFGVSPRGDALWVSACGPTGIFSIEGDTVTPSLTPPNTLWEDGGVLTDAGTLFSAGYATLDESGSGDAARGFALVRTTGAGSTEIGSTLADFGAGEERATLSRCGAGVCGLFSDAVRIWDRDGAVVDTLHRATLGAADDEALVMASGNTSGVYVLLQSEASTRVVFVAWR